MTNSRLEANKRLIRRFYEVIDAGEVDAIDELVADDYVDHNPPSFEWLKPGREGLKQAFLVFGEATPGRHVIEDQLADGDKVVTRLTAEGRYVGALPGIPPPAGQALRQSAIAIHRIANGRIVEHWSVRDDLGLTHQLGIGRPSSLARDWPGHHSDTSRA